MTTSPRLMTAFLLALGGAAAAPTRRLQFATPSLLGSPTAETGARNAMAEDGNDWHTVNLRHNFENPVVMAQMITYNGGHPCHIRVRNVDSNSFQFKIEEWEYLDEWHTTETIQWLVVEEGTYELSSGQQIIVGSYYPMHANWVTIDFAEAFNGTPTVLSMCQTHNGGHAVVTRTDSVNVSSFQVKLQEAEEGQDGVHPNAEIVGYIAMSLTPQERLEAISLVDIIISFANNMNDENSPRYYSGKVA